MPTVTGTQNLTIPVSTDFIEDQPTYLAQMAQQMESRFNSHDDDALRVQPRPFAVIDCQVPISLDLTQLNQFAQMVKFDTVMADTAGLSDLTNNPWALTPNETGWWRAVLNVKVTSSCGAVAGSILQVGLGAQGSGSITAENGSGIGNISQELNITGTTSVNVCEDFIVKTLGSSIGYAGISYCTPCPVAYARLALFKVSDL